MASTYHVEGKGVFDGEVEYTDRLLGNDVSSLLIDVRDKYEAENGKAKGLTIEFTAWPIEE